MPADDLQHTPLTSRHEQMGAKLAPFAGWLMPVEFSGTLAEHEAVRSSVGVFDVSHLGTVWVTGPGARAAVAETFTNDPERLDDGDSQYTLCCDDQGGIVDDLIVYRLDADRYLTVPNAANTPAVVAALEVAAGRHEATVTNESTRHAMIAVQGPDAFALVREALGVDPADVDYLSVRPFTVADHEALLCRTGYTGEPGCELIVPAPAAVAAYDALLEGGGVPAGLGARDTLRLEMGYPLHGNDLSVDTNPYEARLGWAVKLDRDVAFTGKPALRRVKEQGPSRRLWGIRADGRRIPRAGMQVRVDGTEVGTVTSGSFSPTLGIGIGMAYLADGLGPDDEVTVDLRGRDVTFAVVRPPFVDRDPKT